MNNLRTIMQTAVRFAVCIALTAGLLLTAGCSAGQTPGGSLTDYASADAVYTAEFLSEDAVVPTTACCTRSGGVTVMQITAPDRIAGLTVTHDGNTGACSIAAGEMSILLSPETAAGLTEMFDLLARPVEHGGIPAKSPDGSRTIVTYDTGSVTIGEAGVPVEVTFGERTITIGGFTIQPGSMG